MEMKFIVASSTLGILKDVTFRIIYDTKMFLEIPGSERQNTYIYRTRYE